MGLTRSDLLALTPTQLAGKSIAYARRGSELCGRDHPLIDELTDALSLGLPQWIEARRGHLYLAHNDSWPNLYKIGCTRKAVTERLKDLDGAGLATPWILCRAWAVYDAHGLESAAHKACGSHHVNKELFRGPEEVLIANIDHALAQDASRLLNTLPDYLIPEDLYQSLSVLVEKENRQQAEAPKKAWLH